MDLTERVLEGELMDAPDLDVQKHQQALAGLRRVNLFSGTAGTLAVGITKNVRKPSFGALRILDLACGGGDVTRALAKHLSAEGFDCEVTGWDRSPTAIEFARKQMPKTSDASKITFEVRDALSLSADDGFDVVTCTLFLHHLTNDETSQLLSRMYQAAKQLVIIDDLRRTQFGYYLAKLGCHLLSRSPIVHVDGPLSVRAAYLERELAELAASAQLPPAEWKCHWPQRFLMWWRHA